MQVLRTNSPSVAITYFAGYFSSKKHKELQHVPPSDWVTVGRYWGVWKIPRTLVVSPLTYQEFLTLRRILRRVRRARKGGRPLPARVRRRLQRERLGRPTQPIGLWVTSDGDVDLVERLLRWLRPEDNIRASGDAAWTVLGASTHDHKEP